MVDYDILNHYGTTRDMIQTVFTARRGELTPHGQKLLQVHRRKALALKETPKGLSAEEAAAWEPSLSRSEEKGLEERLKIKLIKTRINWEKRIEGRLREGHLHNFRHHRFFYAADMAWDSSPIHSDILPLNLYAQGKININECVRDLKNIFKGGRAKEIDQFVVKDPQKPEDIIGINIPRLHHTIINIVRPLLTRRIAGQVAKYNKNSPYFKYGPRDRKPVSKLRADVMSQRADIMTDQFNYRHMFTQVMRKTLLHGHSVVFPESSWEKHYEMRATAHDEDGTMTTHEKVLVAEGINFIMPHPTRMFYDLKYPLSTLNSDKGINYIGYWDTQRLRHVVGNKAFYNTNAITVSENFVNRFTNIKDFNNCWNDGKTMSLRPGSANIEIKNDRTAAYWLDVQTHGDTEIVLTTYFEKIIPKDEGLGDYPFPVWLRLLVVNDCTVVFGEIMPSTPGAYMGYNEDDTRLMSQSMAHEIIPYQDQLSNFFSQMLYLMKLQSFMILMLDTDIVKDVEMRKEIKAIMAGSRYFSNPMLIEWSAADFREGMNKNPEAPLKFLTNNISSQINDLLKAVLNIMSLAERNQIMSAQELGQTASHEISATESSVIQNATDSLYGYISEAPDEFRAALKRLIYESSVAKGSKQIRTPVLNTYPDHVVRAAGFRVDTSDDHSPDTVEEGSEEDIVNELSSHESSDVIGAPNLQLPGRQTIIGSRHSLVHDYIFTQRDGTEREVNAASARSLVGLVQMIGKNPAVMEAMGKHQLFEMLTEIFRLSGSPFILKLPEGADDEIKSPNSQQIEQVVQQIGQQVQMNVQQLQTFGAALQQLISQLTGQPIQPAAVPVQDGVSEQPANVS